MHCYCYSIDAATAYVILSMLLMLSGISPLESIHGGEPHVGDVNANANQFILCSTLQELTNVLIERIVIRDPSCLQSLDPITALIVLTYRRHEDLCGTFWIHWHYCFAHHPPPHHEVTFSSEILLQPTILSASFSTCFSSILLMTPPIYCRS